MQSCLFFVFEKNVRLGNPSRREDIGFNTCVQVLRREVNPTIYHELERENSQRKNIICSKAKTLL